MAVAEPLFIAMMARLRDVGANMKNTIIIFLLFVIASCTTPPNYRTTSIDDGNEPYSSYIDENGNPPQIRQKITEYPREFKGSFSYLKIGPDLYQVSFTGNRSSSQAYVLEAIIHQSAIFAVGEKRSHFIIVGQITAHESGGNHSGTATIRMTNNLKSAEVVYDARLIWARIMDDEKKEVARINGIIERENARAVEYQKKRSIASEKKDDSLKRDCNVFGKLLNSQGCE